MYVSLASDINNDLYLDENGNIALAYDQQAILIGCKHAAQTILGEMVLQINEGIPDFETVWNGAPNIPQFEAALRVALLNIPGVTQVTSIIATFANNILSYVANIVTVFAPGVVTNNV